MKLYLVIPAFLFGLIKQGHTQENTVSSGGDASGSGGSVSYSVGQVVYHSHSSPNNSITEGIQQPYEISTSVGIEITEITVEMVVYPNPTSDQLTINTGNYNSQNLTYQLFDLQGKILASDQLKNSSSTIELMDLPVSTYLLNILDKNALIKTFRIVKN